MDTFPFAFDDGARRLLRLTGIRPDNSRVVVTADTLVVEFGRWGLETPLANISCIEVTSDYKWFRAVGLRGSLVDSGITFGTNARRGVCTVFHEPVDSVYPGNVMRHPGATVTVADVDGLEATLRSRLDLG